MLRKKDLKRHLNNEKGTAILESVPLIIIFVIFFAYGMGLFGVIHSGILMSISARSYAFETFRNRANTNVFRTSRNASAEKIYIFEEIGFRYHLSYDKEFGGGDITATAKPIVKGLERQPQGDDETTHTINIYEDVISGERNQAVAVHPVWIMIGYGLCINAQCGAD